MVCITGVVTTVCITGWLQRKANYSRFSSVYQLFKFQLLGTKCLLKHELQRLYYMHTRILQIRL